MAYFDELKICINVSWDYKIWTLLTPHKFLCLNPGLKVLSEWGLVEVMTLQGRALVMGFVSYGRVPRVSSPKWAGTRGELCAPGGVAWASNGYAHTFILNFPVCGIAIKMHFAQKQPSPFHACNKIGTRGNHHAEWNKAVPRREVPYVFSDLFLLI